ncbi:hypothetical protein VNO77_02998 [Canavalia gladiata]|uniref:Uncharacterized protein n=1 Tax=Canavalia gladiata TaxID=3824 RepID=A0AAN9R6F3_CANGL
MQDSKAGPLWLRGQYAYHYTVSPVDVIMSFSRFNIIPHVHTPIVSIALTAPLSPLASNFASSWGLHKVASRGLLILVERGNRTLQLGCSVGGLGILRSLTRGSVMWLERDLLPLFLSVLAKGEKFELGWIRESGLLEGVDSKIVDEGHVGLLFLQLLIPQAHNTYTTFSLPSFFALCPRPPPQICSLHFQCIPF